MFNNLTLLHYYKIILKLTIADNKMAENCCLRYLLMVKMKSTFGGDIIQQLQPGNQQEK